jgi:hypothetical protein
MYIFGDHQVFHFVDKIGYMAMVGFCGFVTFVSFGIPFILYWSVRASRSIWTAFRYTFLRYPLERCGVGDGTSRATSRGITLFD